MTKQRKRVLILGSTGSIGRSALSVISSLPGEFELVGLAAGRQSKTLAGQVREHAVPQVAIDCERAEADLAQNLPAGTRLHRGPDALIELVRASEPELVLSAIVGAAGLPATLEAVRLGVDVALANKEALVVAGAILMPLARRTGSRLIPVDSEHSAIFQALHAGRREDVRKIYLTASGGPFREWPVDRIEHATLDEALQHPTWSMGPKVTIDSATMMNKSLEVIEARWLFDLEPEQIEVLIHPESIVHSMVEFADGSVIAQLGTPDMRTPIQYAMTWPRRLPCRAAPLNWREIRQLNFEAPDPVRFPALALGFETAQRGGSCGAVFNAANEAAVEAFRRGEIRFGEISRLIARAVADHETIPTPTLEQLLECDAWARREVRECTPS